MIPSIKSLIIYRAKTLFVVDVLGSLGDSLHEGLVVEKALLLKGDTLFDLLNSIRLHGRH